jgi:hypothetical protein
MLSKSDSLNNLNNSKIIIAFTRVLAQQLISANDLATGALPAYCAVFMAHPAPPSLIFFFASIYQSLNSLILLASILSYSSCAAAAAFLA